MNLKLFVAVVWGVLCVANGAHGDQQGIAGIRIVPLTIQLAAPADKTSCTSGIQFDCMNCSVRAICDSNQQILQVIPCDKFTPYCNDGICSMEPPQNGCTQTISSLCPSAGTFPSTTSCQNYIQCSAKRVPTEYKCPAALVYDPKTHFCKRRVYATDCPNINCAYYRNKFIAYPGDKQIYFFCGASNSEIKVLKCPNGEEFNQQMIICEKKCNDTGFIAAPEKNKYYLCVETGTDQYEKYLQVCPSGTKFDEKTKVCAVPTPPTTAPSNSTTPHASSETSSLTSLASSDSSEVTTPASS